MKKKFENLPSSRESRFPIIAWEPLPHALKVMSIKDIYASNLSLNDQAKIEECKKHIKFMFDTIKGADMNLVLSNNFSVAKKDKTADVINIDYSNVQLVAYVETINDSNYSSIDHIIGFNNVDFEFVFGYRDCFQTKVEFMHGK